MVDLLADSSLIAFSFLHPAALAWAAVAAVPILIHLWNRRRRQQADWPHLIHLAAAMHAKRRRIWFANRGVLLMRIAAICLIALAVAEPTGSAGLFGSPSGTTHHILVIDGSYSMRTLSDEDGNGASTRFDRAIRTARDIVAGAPEGDSFSVILMARPSRLLTQRPAVDRGSLDALLENLDPPERDFDLASALRLVKESMAAPNSGASRVDRRTVYFFTDLQRHGWGQVDAADDAGVPEAIRAISKRASIVVYDIGRPVPANTSIVAMGLDDNVPSPGREIGVSGTIRFFPDATSENSAKRETMVELYRDGRLVGNRTVTFNAAGETQVEFPLVFETPGEHVLEMRLPDDRLPLDNRRFLVVDVATTLSALVIQPPGKGPDYLQLALAAEDAATAGIRVAHASEDALAGIRLDAFDAVFLDGVRALLDGTGKAIADYVRRGGRLIVFPPAEAGLDRFNDSFGTLFPLRLEGRVTLHEPETVLPVDETSPLLRPFSGRGATALLTTPVFAHYAIEPGAGRPDTSTILAADDAPVLIEYRIGRGNVFMFTVPLDPAWTALPLWPSFVPLVREAVTVGAAERAVSGNVLVGEPLSGIAGNIGSLRVLEIERPDGARVRLPFESAPGGSAWTFADTNHVGVYRVCSTLTGTVDADPELLAYRAVNPATAESNLASTDLAAFRDRLPEAVLTVVPAASREAGSLHLLASPPSSSWSPWLLLAALAILLAETWTATVPPKAKASRPLRTQETWHR